jgi:soluble lytic murein transglycosylase-like protein
MHNSLSLFGLLSVAVVVMIAAHPEYAHAVGRWIVPGDEAPAPAPVVEATPDPLTGAIAHQGSEAGRMLGLAATPAEPAIVDAPVVVSKVSTTVDRAPAAREKREVASYLSKKYRVNVDAVAMLVDAAYTTGKDLGLDPLLLLSVMGVESGFNPFAESTAGASGLMQLMSKVHRDKLNDFGGSHIALNPVVNLRVGAVVLKDCIRRGGSIADGLRLYVGAGMGDDSGYGSRVLQEKDKLAQVVRGNARPRIEPIPATAARPAHDAPRLDEKLDPKLDTHRPARGNDADSGRFASL